MNKNDFLIGILIILVTVLPTNLASQTVSCTLIDSLSKEPVIYASISSGSFVCYSDDEGVFSAKELPGDTLMISRLGYETLTVPKSELTTTVLLIPKSYTISEIEISGNPESFEVGYHDWKSWGLSKMNSYFQGVLIQKPNRNCMVETVLVHTSRNRKGTVYIIGLFSVSDDGLPGDLIFSKEYKSPTGRNLLEISVDEANIEMREGGIVVAIKSNEPEYRGVEQRDYGFVRFTKRSEGNVSYFHAVNRWFELDASVLDYIRTYKIGLELVPF